MKKFALLMFVLMFGLTACNQGPTPESLAQESIFGVSFNKIDNEKMTASFTVSGLPNEEEFNQISQVITDSMNAQELEEDAYTVSVYRDGQDLALDPEFGTVTFTGDKITDNKLKNITVEQYLGEVIE